MIIIPLLLLLLTVSAAFNVMYYFKCKDTETELMVANADLDRYRSTCMRATEAFNRCIKTRAFFQES